MKIDGMQNELALICAARDGNREALDTLLTRHWAWLKALVYAVLADPWDIDDVLQEVCLRVVTRVHTLREPECFCAWLAILVRREAIKHHRGRSRRSNLMDAASAVISESQADPDPLDRLEREELCRKVLGAVSTLPEKYREVFMLAHSGELTYAQMAEVLDVPVTTMQIRLVRARRMVQNQLKDAKKQKVPE